MRGLRGSGVGVRAPSVSIRSGMDPSSLLGKDAESGKGIVRAIWCSVHSRSLFSAFKDLTSDFRFVLSLVSLIGIYRVRSVSN